MKLATEPYDDPQKDRGIGRMIVLSAVLHAVVIGALLVTGHLRFTKPQEPLSAAYEVSLVGPSGSGRRKATDERATAAARPSAIEKAPPPSAKSEQRESLPVKPEPQAKPQPQEKPKPVEQAKPKVKETPLEKPQEIAKKAEPPKPKPAPVVQEKEPPKVVAAAKPVEKKSSPPEKKVEEVKVKEPIKPKVEARLSEKKEKPKEKPPVQTERAKVEPKKPEVVKAEDKSKAPSTPAKPEKKPQEVVQATAKEKVNTAKKTEKTEKAETPSKKATAAVPSTAKTSVSTDEDAAQARADAEARERMIASAVDRVRAREESASREQDIAKAIDRVRQGVGGRDERSKETEKQPAAQSDQGKDDGDGRIARAKVYGPEFIAYTESIKQKVKEGWIVPDRKPGLTAVVQFGVEASGEVVDAEIVQPSGDRAFDQSALRAVRNAKLPPPPELYREDFVTQKVHMTFGGEE
jgi:colicin import membrane protein